MANNSNTPDCKKWQGFIGDSVLLPATRSHIREFTGSRRTSAAGEPRPQFFTVARIPGGLLDEELRTWHPRLSGRSWGLG